MVGDSGLGTPLNPLGYDPARPWYGIRVNAEGAYAVGANVVFTNLQTMLIVNGLPLFPANSSGNRTAPPSMSTQKVSRDDVKEDRKRVQEMLKSPILQRALAERAARIDAMRRALDNHRK